MKLFLDANIYLRFYDSKKENFQKLIDPLLQAKSHILITNQIVDEVVRNRFSDFKRSFDGYLQQSQMLNTELPVHISSALDQKVKDWNSTRKKLFQEVQKSNAELAKIADKAIDEVYDGHDKVSKSFDQIFKRSLKPKPKEIEAATLRKAVGNPPGKRPDPLGDQLSWTQLINNLKGVKTLIMVTADRDYSVEDNKKKLRLDPLLMKELKAKYPSIVVEIFNELTPALKRYNAISKTLTKLPAQKELDLIEKEEQFISGSTISQMINSGSSITDIIKNTNPSISRGMHALLDAINTTYCVTCEKSTPSQTAVIDINNEIVRIYHCIVCGHNKSE